MACWCDDPYCELLQDDWDGENSRDDRDDALNENDDRDDWDSNNVGYGAGVVDPTPSDGSAHGD